jgi:hypothetical protein
MRHKDQNDHLHLELRVDNVPYVVDADACRYNDGVQYKVKVNDSDETLFVFDSELGRYYAAGDNGGTFPENVERAIGDELNRDSRDRLRG